MEFMYLLVQSMKELREEISEDKEDRGVVKAAGSPNVDELFNESGTHPAGRLVVVVAADRCRCIQHGGGMVGVDDQGGGAVVYQGMAMQPLDRVHHRPNPPPAVPEVHKQELIAAKRLAAFAILAHLFTVYCPGGLGEKQNLLRSLVEPGEAATLSECATAIRKWMRWRARAREVGATEPDASILMKGLNRLSRKVLAAHSDLKFRIALAENALQVDLTPTAGTVSQYVAHLLAEVEQLALTEKRMGGGAKAEVPKVKKFETGGVKAKGKGKGKDEKKDEEEELEKKKKGQCRLLLTESGCRKGKACE